MHSDKLDQNFGVRAVTLTVFIDAVSNVGNAEPLIHTVALAR